MGQVRTWIRWLRPIAFRPSNERIHETESTDHRKHIGVAATAALSMGIASLSGAPPAVAFGISVVVAATVGWFVAQSVRRGLGVIEGAVTSEPASSATTTKLVEFEALANQIDSVMARWSDAVAAARGGIREVEDLVAQLDHRTDGRTSSEGGTPVFQLRRLLGELVDALQPDLNQLVGEAGELDGKITLVASGTANQTEAVSRTTTYVEQMSVQFDSVAEVANAAQHAAQTARESTRSAQTLISEHVGRMETLRSRMDGTERKLRSLRERSQAIGSIIETIGAISSRTDLLALNASIESFRAGEQGRGFSVVAEEVRKLAEQAAQATTEISALIETMQADAESSAQAIAEQRSNVTSEIGQISSTSEQITKIGETCEISANLVTDISQLAAQQLHLTQNLVTTVERISETNRTNRSQAEEAGWMTRSIVKAARNLNTTLDPLRIGTNRRFAGNPQRSALPSGNGAPPHEESSLDQRNGIDVASLAEMAR